MSDTLLRRLGIDCPILQAPMAGVNTPRLAAAVSNAGGLGGLGMGASNAASARQQIADTRALTTKAFNVNFFCHRPARADAAREARWLQWLAPQFARFGAEPPKALREIYTSFVADRDMVAMLLEVKPAVVSFHFGLPSAEVLAALRGAGIALVGSATSLDEARAAERAGLDAVVAQGIEAGGHRGVFDPDAPDERLGIFALTRLLVRGTRLPVIAAGGIMDGAGIAAMLTLGAQAAQLGTAFVACPESAIDEGFRRAITSGERRTTFTASISGRLARGLANAFTELDQDPAQPPRPDYPIVYDAGKALHAAGKAKGFYGFGAQWAGQAVQLIRELPAGELVSTLRAELDAALRR